MDCIFLLFLLSSAAGSISGNTSIEEDALSVVTLYDGVPLMAENISSINDSRIRIEIFSGNHKLTNKVYFMNKEVVSVTGESLSSTSTLRCSEGKEAGFMFENVAHVIICDVSFFQCGFTYNYTQNKPYYYYTHFSTAVFIINGSNISIANTILTQSKGVGLVILESYGTTNIENSNFSSGKTRSQLLNGGGGVYIELRNKEKENASFNLTNCVFRNNNASSNFIANTVLSLGNGGGLNLHFKQYSGNITARVAGCLFNNNHAQLWGGGLNIAISNASRLINVSVLDSVFMQNDCQKGGGGIDVGYLFFNDILPQDTRIHFFNCTFERNRAHFAGGALIYSTQSDTNDSKFIESNEIEFENCTWVNNTASYSSALYLYPHILGSFNSANNLLPRPSLKDCTFIGNKVSDTEYVRHRQRGKGSLMSIGYDFIMSGNMVFWGNNGTALYLISSMITVLSNTRMTFEGNTGYNGGALSLFGSSVLHVHSNTTFLFRRNNATLHGGAIYQEDINTLDYIAMKNCFFHYYNPRKGKKDVHFEFTDNHCNTIYCGHSIFLSSVQACNALFNFTFVVLENVTENSSNVATFTFTNGAREEISSVGTKFNFTGNLSIFAIPGKVKKIPVEVINDFKQAAPRVYHVALTKLSGSISLDEEYTHVFSNNILLYGEPNAKGNLFLSLRSSGDKEVSLHVRLQECPPGYILYTNSCECSADKSSITERYPGIVHCNRNTSQAYLKRGFWVGYKNQSTDANSEGTATDLITSLCPKRYCMENRLEKLLNATTVRELNDIVCFHRNGILCAQCKKHYSVFYHLDEPFCKRNKYCEWGWAFYILSEVLPVTALFVAIVVFDVQLTAGPVQSFVLYVQTVGTLHITASRQIWLHIGAFHLQKYLKFFTNMFNLDFFTLERLSFCLWENATTLDMYAMKYVSIVYSLCLVLCTVALLNCKFKTLQKCLRRLRRADPDIGTSIIHGLSGFLVMCYSQCTYISLQILTPATLYEKGWVEFKTVSFYDGTLDYMRGRHLLYALPALMFVVFMVILPPLLLISYPLCYRVFSFLHIEESKFAKVLCKIIPLEKFRAFFDSFQASFKDKFRFFSGLYFMYRLLALVAFAYFQNLSHFYTVVEIQFLVILAVHAWVQPHKVAWHNKLDAFIFATLAVINSLTLYNYVQVTSNYHSHFDYIVDAVSIIQAVICYLPIFYMVVYLTGKAYYRVRASCSQKFRKKDDHHIMFSLSLLNYHHQHDDHELSCSYHKSQ